MTESERKFLVLPEDLPDHFLSGRDGVRIEQYYLAIGPEVEVRVRKMCFGQMMRLQIKTGGTQKEREEISFDLRSKFKSFDDGRKKVDDILDKAIGVVKKVRYTLEKGMTLDKFDDQDFLLLEIENSDALPPKWAGEEVTGDPDYYNQNLMISTNE